MPEYRRTDTRAPLGYVLCGLVFGFSLSKHFPVEPALLAVSALAVGGWAFFQSIRTPDTRFWAPPFLIAATLCAWAYGGLRASPTPDALARQLPAREAQLELRIQQVYTPNLTYGSASGIAQVRNAPPLSRLRPGSLVYFRCDIDPEHPDSVLPEQQILAQGVLRPIAPAEHSGEISEFDNYLRDIGVHYRFERLMDWQVIQPAPIYQAWLARANRHFESILQAGATPSRDFHRVYTAMLLGKKDALSEHQRTLYQESGTMHFFAISGLHIGVIASVIAQCLFIVRIPRRYAPCIGLPLLFAYVMITGAEPSAMRAFLMTAFFWGAYAINRQRAPIPSLVASAVTVLLINPDQLWSVGFQLSYAVVLGILLLGLPLSQFLQHHWQPYRYIPPDALSTRQRAIRFVFEKGCLLFAISLSAWLASAPISAAFFGFVAPVAIILNILLVNLVALVICTGVLSLGVGLLGLVPISGALNHAAWALIHLTDLLISSVTQFPYSMIPTEGFPVSLCYGLMLLQIALLLWFHRHPRHPAAGHDNYHF